MPWHVLALMEAAVERGFAAFSQTEAARRGLPWLDLVRDKPPTLHLVLTGRGAPPELIDVADLVSEIQPIKHPLARGIKGQRGIEF